MSRVWCQQAVLWRILEALRLLGLVVACGAASRADDDDPPIPPLDPGSGFEGILPNPTIPPTLVIDQRTSPYGVRQVFNTPETIMGQSFTPTNQRMDWVGFVLQNNPQPGTIPGPGVLRARIYTNLNSVDGTLSGLLGESGPATIPADSTAWLIFTFPETVPLTPGQTYYCHLRMVSGYPSWAGGRLQNFYSRGQAFGFLPNPFGGPPQNLRWQQYDLVFAQGSGRSPLGGLLADYVQWVHRRGLNRLNEYGDLDGDGLPNWMEFLRDSDPTNGAPSVSPGVRFALVDGQRYFSLTVATPSAWDYTPEPDGTWMGSAGQILERFLPRRTLARTGGDGFALVEMPPPLDEGRPPLSPFHQYRTFRIREPVEAAPEM